MIPQLHTPCNTTYQSLIAAESHPSSDRLQDAGQGVLLQLEQVRRLAVHLETVGVVVELHWTHKVAVAGHHVGELEEREEGEEALGYENVDT